VDSDGIVSAAYCADDRRLQIEFRGGRVYDYFDVPQTAADWFWRVSNKAAYVRSVLTVQFRYRAVPAEVAQPDLAAALGASLEWLRARSPQ